MDFKFTRNAHNNIDEKEGENLGYFPKKILKRLTKMGFANENYQLVYPK